jgi:hypothetical protein
MFLIEIELLKSINSWLNVTTAGLLILLSTLITRYHSVTHAATVPPKHLRLASRDSPFYLRAK